MLWFTLGLALAYLVACWFLADGYLRPKLDPLGLVPVGFEETKVAIEGKEVGAWATKDLLDDAPKVTFVLVHGYGGSQSHWSNVGIELAKQGHGVIIPTLPGHYDPTDPETGFGLKESRRLVALVDRLRSTKGPKDRKVVLVGVSMGGAASWLATEAGAKVDGVVTEGAFARFEDAMNNWFDRAVPLGRYVLRPVVWIASARNGLSPSAVVPATAAARWRGRPALVIQGGEDRLIPMPHAEALSSAAGCPLWVVEGARHAQCPDVAGDDYVRRLVAFAEAL